MTHRKKLDKLARKVAEYQRLNKDMVDVAAVSSSVGAIGAPLAAAPGLGEINVVDTAAPPTQSNVPGSWSRYWLGPGQPFTPIMDSARDKDAEQEPRSFQYVPGVNATISPRLAYGLTPFSQLRSWAENTPEVAMCVRLLTEEIKAFVPTITDMQDAKVDDPGLQWMVEHPDGFNPWPVWLSRFLYNVLVYDAGCAYLIRDERGSIVGSRVIDGSTIFVLIDEKGNQPEPPAPAFTQVIFGVPKMFLNRRQLWYKPRHLRADAPYGRAGTEDAKKAVELLQALWDYEAQKYIVGNIPEMVFACPEAWGKDAEAILEYETAFNARMSGSNMERVRARFVPYGMEAIQTKEMSFNQESYDAATNSVRMAYGVVQSEVGEAPTGGLGGKGYAEAMQSAFYRMGLAPLISYIEGHFNDILAMNGVTNRRFRLEFPPDTLDPEKEENKWQGRFVSGIANRDETREALDMERLGGDAGDFLVTPGKGGDDGGGEGEGGGLAGLLGGNGKGGVKVAHGLPSHVPVGGKQIAVMQNRVGVMDNPVQVGKLDNGNDHSPKDGMGDGIGAEEPPIQTGVMVALVFDKEVCDELCSFGGTEPADQLHLTLADLGDISEQRMTEQQLIAAVQAFVNPMPVIRGSIQGVGRFLGVEDGTKDCLYASFDCPDLPAYRQLLVEHLTRAGFAVATDHGFTPHITLAYVPTGQELVLHPHRIEEVYTVTSSFWGSTQTAILPLTPDGEVALTKHCGVCSEDDQWFDAPAEEAQEVGMPHQGANESRIVSIGTPEMGTRPAVFKPVEGEDKGLQDWVGGPLYLRSEVAYLIDREMAPDDEHFLVPVTYITEVNGQKGSVQHYVRGRESRKGAQEYGEEWIMQAAAFEFVTGQVDRADRNWLTHPDDPRRPVLIDSDLCAPVDPDEHLHSSFIDAWAGKLISPDLHEQLRMLQGNHGLWSDISECLQDQAAVDGIKRRLDQLVETGMIPADLTTEVEVQKADAATIEKADWDESKHKRGNPENAGQFSSAGGDDKKEEEESSKKLGDVIKDPDDSEPDKMSMDDAMKVYDAVKAGHADQVSNKTLNAAILTYQEKLKAAGMHELPKDHILIAEAKRRMHPDKPDLEQYKDLYDEYENHGWSNLRGKSQEDLDHLAAYVHQQGEKEGEDYSLVEGIIRDMRLPADELDAKHPGFGFKDIDKQPSQSSQPSSQEDEEEDDDFFNGDNIVEAMDRAVGSIADKYSDVEPEDLKPIDFPDLDRGTKEKLLYQAGTNGKPKRIGYQGVNLTLVADIEGDGRAVIKPEVMDGGYGGPSNEVCTYELSNALGFDVVPVTTYRNQDGLRASAQEFVQNAVMGMDFGPGVTGEVTFETVSSMSAMSVMDLISGNYDRHAGNWMYDKKTGRIVAIDNGFAFLSGSDAEMSAIDQGLKEDDGDIDPESNCNYVDVKVQHNFDRLGESPVLLGKHVVAAMRFAKDRKAMKQLFSQHFPGEEKRCMETVIAGINFIKENYTRNKGGDWEHN